MLLFFMFFLITRSENNQNEKTFIHTLLKQTFFFYSEGQRFEENCQWMLIYKNKQKQQYGKIKVIKIKNLKDFKFCLLGLGKEKSGKMKIFKERESSLD